MRWIYISPHLDDAILSAGGLIYEQTKSGLPVEIWTLLSGFPPQGELSMYAQVMHHQWGISSADELIRMRRAEDMKAASTVGALAVHFDFLDCIYRRGQTGEWLYSDIFAPPHEEDASLPRQMADAISARLTRDSVLVCPLGLGSHVDHLLVRRAAELCGRPLLYVADIPYLFNYPESLSPETAGMKENARLVTEAGLTSWQEAIAAYASQLGGLFDSPDHMRASIRQYWAERGGVRLYSA